MQISVAILVSGCNNALNYIVKLISTFKERVISDSGLFEAEACLDSELNKLNVIGLLRKASLIITPNAVKESKLYSVIPNTSLGDMSVVRATTATRVNSDGLVELVPYNLFVNSIWAGGGSLPTSWVSNLTTGTSTPTTSIKNPNVTAYRFITSDTRRDFYQNFSIASNSVVCLSVYVEVVTVPIQVSAMLRISGTVGTGTSVFLKNNVVIPSNTNIEAGNIYTLQFTCIIADTTFSGRVGCGMLGNVTGDFVLSMPQLEQGSIPKPYFYTTNRLNIPRLNYDVAGGCPSILLEPQRTNLSLYSENYENSYFSKTNTIISSNVINSPNNTLSADKLYENTATGSHGGEVCRVNSISTITSYSTSFFVKKGEKTSFQLWVRGASSNNRCVWNVDLNLKTLTFNNNFGNFVKVSESIKELPNDWFLITNTITVGAGETLLSGVLWFNGTASYTGDGVSGLYIWGGQIEQGSYPTSYIPTVESTVTRNADVISRNNIFTNGLITSVGGTWFIELNNNIALIREVSGSEMYIGESNTSAVANFFKSISIRNNGGGAVSLWINYWDGTLLNPLYNITTSTAKIAIKFNGTTLDVFVNGVKVVTNYSAPITLTNFQYFNFLAGVTRYIKSTYLFPTPLTDTECTQLTTL